MFCVGSMQLSFLPNQRYRLRAINLYTALRNGPGTSHNSCTHCQYQLNCRATCKAASDCWYTCPFLISRNVSKCFCGSPYCCNNFCPAPDCNGANLNTAFLSCCITSFTTPLQRLQTPSNNITGCSMLKITFKTKALLL